MELLVAEVQSCAFSRRPIHMNLHMIRYSLQCFGAQVHLGQSKTFCTVDYRYLLSVLLKVVWEGLARLSAFGLLLCTVTVSLTSE